MLQQPYTMSIDSTLRYLLSVQFPASFPFISSCKERNANVERSFSVSLLIKRNFSDQWTNRTCKRDFSD